MRSHARATEATKTRANFWSKMSSKFAVGIVGEQNKPEKADKADQHSAAHYTLITTLHTTQHNPPTFHPPCSNLYPNPPRAPTPSLPSLVAPYDR